MAEIDRNEYFEDIVTTLGTTDIWTAAGFIIPDGRLINLSNIEVYPDPTVRYYTHNDLEKFFGYAQDEILINGAIRLGYGDTSDIPYAHIVLQKYQPTAKQWEKIEELLNTEPKILDLELDLDIASPMTSFYKRYNAEEHTIRDIRADTQAYINGDKTNWGRFSEKLGIKDIVE